MIIKAQIMEKWDMAGRRGLVLGPNVFAEQNWTPILWEGEKAPDFHKAAGLMFYEEGQTFNGNPVANNIPVKEI